jgi:hypothetical protein
VPEIEGDGTVSVHPGDDEDLRRAFQALADSSAGECSHEDLDRIWLAVAGELPVAERQELVERLATEPACAEAWRVAHELRRNLPVAAVEQRRPAWRPPSWLTAAAIVLLATAVLLVSRRGPSTDTEFRDAGRTAIESLVPSDAALPRSAFRLRWSAGPQDSRYQVRVTTEDLRPVATAGDLTRPELLIEAAQLAAVPEGSRVLWQVEVTQPNGERVLSPTFVTRVQ